MDSIASKSQLNEIQKGLLFEILRHKKKPYYLDLRVFHFAVKIESSLFFRAWEKVIERHEMLRSAISFDSFEPVLFIHQKVEVPTSFYNYSLLEETAKQKAFNALVEEEFNTPIDVNKAPLMRFAWVQFDENKYSFLLMIHHLLIDGSSLVQIIDEVFTIYLALLNKRTWDLPPPIPFYEVYKYATNLNENIAQDYWKNRLRDYSLAALLPSQTSQESTFKKTNQEILLIKGKDYAQLTALINKFDLSTNTLLQAAWGILLSHFSGKEYVIFGTVRAYPKKFTQGSVGLFLNTLPISLHLSADISLRDYFNEVRDQNKKLRDYLAISVSRIHEWCNLALDIPLYQNIIDYKPFSLNKYLASQFPELTCKTFFKMDSPYPLLLDIIDEGDNLEINLHYDRSLFEPDYMKDFLQHYKRILLKLFSNPELTLKQLPTMDEAKLQKIMLTSNKMFTDYPRAKTIHQLFEEQVAKTPMATAIIYGEQSLSYQELNEKANQIAHYLIQQGVTREIPVAIWVRPNLSMMPCVLGVLKAGGAYIPVDAHYPSERIKYFLNDSKPKVVITESTYLAQLQLLVDGSAELNPGIINIDDFHWNSFSKENPKMLGLSSTNLMYIIYTSGTTGLPKGVLVEHRSVVNMALACIKRLEINAKSRLLQIASFSFDVFIAEWCLALLSGASLTFIDKEIFSPAAIIHALKTYQITTIILAHSILAMLPREHLPDLKVIATGGESVDQHVLEFWGPGRRFVNVYGITETAVCSSMGDCAANQKIITIGAPLENTQIYVLDNYLRILPTYVPGEIYIGGTGIARGYLNNPELTATQFLLDPFSSSEKNAVGKQRLYKTGDIGRLLPTGEIEFLGRRDDQIKIRGFRIELTEIEKMIVKYPGITKAAAVMKELASSKQLMLYVLIEPGLSINAAEARKFLINHLPHYMVPTQITVLKEFPLTVHGKIDKKKLLDLAPFLEVNQPLPAKLTHSNATTQQIARIIQSLLHCPEVAYDRNFLDIGLNSFTLVQLSMRLSNEFKRDIDITTLFTYTTVTSLAQYLRGEVNA